MCYGCVPVGGTVALYLLLRFVFDTYIASNVKERFFLHCIFLLPIKPVLSVALTGCRLCPSDADTIFRLKETLRIPLKFPYLPAPGTYSHPCLRCASLARPCASVAGCRTKFQVPLTAIKRHPYSGGQYRHLVKHWKDCFLSQKEKYAA